MAQPCLDLKCLTVPADQKRLMVLKEVKEWLELALTKNLKVFGDGRGKVISEWKSHFDTQQVATPVDHAGDFDGSGS